MPGLAAAFEEITRDAATAGRSHLEALAACLAAEVASRAEHRLASRLRAARFAAEKSFDFALQPSLEKARVLALGRAEFIAAKEYVVCLGRSGTGKTHWRSPWRWPPVPAGIGCASSAPSPSPRSWARPPVSMTVQSGPLCDGPKRTPSSGS